MTEKNIPKIRFPGFSDPWEQRKLGDFSTKVTSKNIDGVHTNTLTNSAEYGIIDQNDYFDKSISNPDNIKGYYIVHLDDFVYNPRISNLAPCGPIKRNKQYKTGIMSPLYTVFKVRDIDKSFLEVYFETDNWHPFMRFHGDTGARSDRFAIKDKSFFEMPIMLPSGLEQTKISNLFYIIDKAITLHQRKLDDLKSLKSGLLQKMFPKPGSAFPEVRFPEFTDPWEQRKFDEVFDCTIPNNTLSRAELNYESGSVRNIHYGDILIKYGSVVDVQNDEIPFATGKSSDDFKGALLQDGDIIIADTAEDETTGKACEIGNSQGLDIVSGLHTMVCRPRNKMALGYLGYYLNSDAYHHQLLPLMQGIKVLSLSRTNVQKTMVCYPKSKAEQQLIADCFRNLDNLITLHQRKLENLKLLKQGFLQQMFV